MPQPSTAAPVKDPRAVTHYHAHVYYDPASSRGRAERLRERVGAEFPQTKLGRWHDELVGPHPQSMYQIAFASEMLEKFMPWLMLNRDGLTILLHPVVAPMLAEVYPEFARRVFGHVTPIPSSL